MRWRTKVSLCVLMGLGVMCVFHSYFNLTKLMSTARTAACCAVRTALSGAMLDPDLTCKAALSFHFIPHTPLFRSFTAQSLTPHASGAISANLAWRLPEVNIGIVCANAPTFRPLYLLFRGRLDTANRPSKGSYNSSRSRTVVPPENSRWGARSATLQGSGGGSKIHSDDGEKQHLKLDSTSGIGGKDIDVELEMGLPMQYPSGVHHPGPSGGVGPGPGYSGRKEAWQ